MELSIFAKKRINREGKNFTTYLTTLKKNNGESITASVKFREECGAPKPEKCPCNIIVNKEHANLSVRDYVVSDTGEVKKSYTLWVFEWSNGGEYVDHSLDDFE